MVQEGLTNSLKHGKATHVRLHFWQEEHGVWVHINDNGLGSRKMSEGIGIAGMRERIEQLGGRLRAANKQDGFELSAWIPREGAEHEQDKSLISG